ncbi:hypothetical protein [Stenotrophomonas acidaminiphila]|uniref:hypothetical protein n=1 Tax=Stenotrophomonas acidaminiphila TaxID=128780 RepID=UPI0028AD22A9|nr:hypothetical protein [Stenotrophomonas acidaminiphila]
MKTKSQQKLAFLKAQRTAKLTKGDLRGLAAAKVGATKLKLKYSSLDMVEAKPVSFSVMAGPTKKKALIPFE